MRLPAFTPPRLVLLAAIGLHVLLAWQLADAAGTWSEELSVHASRGYRVLAIDRESAQARVATTCAEGERWVWSESRPRLSLCAGGVALPVMIDSYLGGVVHWPLASLWPLHHGNAFVLRKIGFVLGVIDLLALYLLAARLRDERTAVVSTTMAVSSPFLFTHSLLVHYEVLPWLLTCLAILLIDPIAPRSTAGRVIAAAALVAAAILANIKTLFLLAPMVLLVLARRRAWLRRIRWPAWVGSGAAVVLVTSPIVLFAALDPLGGFGAQVSRRASTLVSRLEPRHLPGEIVNLLTHGTDIGAYLTSPGGHAHPALLVPAGLALVWACAQLVRWLRGREADRLGVLGAVLLSTYLLVAWLLYDQQPPANYGPLYAVFGMTFGAALAALFRALEARASQLVSRSAMILVSTAIVATGAGLAVVRANSAGGLTLSINGPAQRALAASIARRVPDGATVVTTTYNLAGVVESLAGDRVSALQAHVALRDCYYEDADRSGCFARALSAVLDVTGDDCFVITIATETPIDEPHVVDLGPALAQIASARGLSATRVDQSTNANGVVIYELYRVARRP